MKIKILIPIVLSIVIGFFLGKLFFNQYNDNTLTVFNEGEKVYFVQMGSYLTLDELKSSIDDYEEYLYVKEDNNYHLYVGITKNEKIAKKIKVYYESLNNNIYIEEKNINNYTFLNLLSEYDKITTIALADKDLINLEKIVISNYKEMVLESEFVN